MFSKKTIAFLLSLMMVMPFFAACGSDDKVEDPTEVEDTEDGEEEADDSVDGDIEESKLLLLIPGSLGDKSFFDSAKAGFDAIEEEYGDSVEVEVTELGEDDTAYLPAVEEAAQEDWDIIFSVGWQIIEAFEEVAPMYPDKKFVICDSSVDFEANDDLDNVMAVTYKANEGSFLAGVVAGSLTETDKLGFVGGIDSPLIKDFLVGFIEGAQAVNPDVSVIPSFIGDYQDSARAKELAIAQFNDGVDVGFQVAGAAGFGQIEAAVELDKLVIGVDSDQAMLLEEKNPEMSEIIPTSMLKNVGNSLILVFEQHLDGTAKWGEEVILGLEEDAVGIASNKYYEELVPQEVRDLVEEYTEKIKSGEVEVQDAYSLSQEELEEFISKAQ